MHLEFLDLLVYWFNIMMQHKEVEVGLGFGLQGRRVSDEKRTQVGSSLTESQLLTFFTPTSSPSLSRLGARLD